MTEEEGALGFNPDEERDDLGRWSGGGAGPASAGAAADRAVAHSSKAREALDEARASIIQGKAQGVELDSAETLREAYKHVEDAERLAVHSKYDRAAAAYGKAEALISKVADAHPGFTKVGMARQSIKRARAAVQEGGSLSAPNDLRIVEERADGSGVVELPILRTHESLNLDLTATRDSAGRVDSITVGDLESAVANFARWPGPMPIFRVPHRSLSESQGASDGFLERLWVDGETLWARAELCASLFKEVKARRWRGFSVDYGRGATMATGRMDGFLIAGGVFTNRPAADVHFKVAASGVESISDGGSAYIGLGARTEDAEEEDMAEEKDLKVSLATAEAKVEAAEGKVASLAAKAEKAERAAEASEKDLKAARQQVASLSSEVSTLRLQAQNRDGDSKDKDEKIAALEEKSKDMRAKLEAVQNETLGSKVTALCRAAIKEGVPPAKIKELGDFEKDPVRWLTANFVSIETAAHFLKALPRDASLSADRKGERVADESDAAMDKDRLANLKQLGLNPKLAGVATQSQFEELSQSGQLKK